MKEHYYRHSNRQGDKAKAVNYIETYIGYFVKAFLQ